MYATTIHPSFDFCVKHGQQLPVRVASEDCSFMAASLVYSFVWVSFVAPLAKNPGFFGLWSWCGLLCWLGVGSCCRGRLQHYLIQLLLLDQVCVSPLPACSFNFVCRNISMLATKMSWVCTIHHFSVLQGSHPSLILDSFHCESLFLTSCGERDNMLTQS